MPTRTGLEKQCHSLRHSARIPLEAVDELLVATTVEISVQFVTEIVFFAGAVDFVNAGEIVLCIPAMSWPAPVSMHSDAALGFESGLLNAGCMWSGHAGC